MEAEIPVTNQQNSERVFYKILLRIGAIGKYQYVCLMIWGILYMISSSSSFCIPYLFYQPPYVCNDLSQNQCLTHVCSLPYELRSAFSEGSKRTLINKFGDFRCEQSQQIDGFQSAIYVSALIGVVFGAFLNTIFRKKLLVESCIFLSIICFAIILLVDNLILLVVLLCLNQALQIIIQQLLICFITEDVHEDERGKHTMIMFIFFNIASIINGFLFKILEWEHVILFYFIVVLVLSFIGVKFYIKQTPFDLITNFSPEAALQDINWIAEQNGNKQTHKITVVELANIKEQYESNMAIKQKVKLSALDLFRFSSLRMDVIVCFLLHTFISFNYYSPVLALSQFSADIYLNGIIFSSASTISSICCYFVINELQRKKIINYTIIASLVFIPPLYLTSKCSSKCSGENKWIQTVSVFLFRFILQITYQAYYFIQNEIFPTQIRPQAILVTAGASNISRMLVPIVSNFNRNNKLVFPLSFVTSGTLVLALMSQIRETVGVPPPQIIQQLAYPHKISFQGSKHPSKLIN